jgi:hypothetical protein
MSRLNDFQIGDRVIFKFGYDFEKGTIIGKFNFGYEIEKDNGHSYIVEDDHYRRISLVEEPFEEKTEEKSKPSYFRRLWCALWNLDSE